ncbi:MAG: urease accessory protein UreD [Symplocastrum torsivum CPER-KK1]|uniref:Urease accessory protein UreD n=1 Tax=Symplocastrum torsivum CPER-KK1 TaxID=450513 RepID=A0A951PKH6_9CYAN|nr:urease accessory protein UreD [Symplocastrum torsivum CPER-KK1]
MADDTTVRITTEASEATQIPTGWHGSLDLVYVHNDGTTKLIHNQVQSPLKVQRPFYPEGEAVCHSVVLHTAGGMVGGDRLAQTIHLKPNAQALITTAAASKVYRSNGQDARQTIKLQIEAGAYLEWLPQETIVFNGAIYQQDLRVELAPQASWLGWEITRFGRSARGETFLQGEWRSHTEVWQQGQPLWIDRQWLPAGEDIINSPHGLAGQPIVATLSWIGQPVSREILDTARILWNSKERQGEAGVTQLISGLVCRYRGASTLEVRNWFTDIWQLLRLSSVGRSVTKPRVWQM